MKGIHIQVELHDADGRTYRYDGPDDGPLNAWLASMAGQLTADLGNLMHNATIRLWRPKD